MWFGHFPQLQHLALDNNKFTGPIPASISNLSKLEFLNFEDNSLRGNIPEQIGNLHSLKILNLQSNQLFGSIPLSIFNISGLENRGHPSLTCFCSDVCISNFFKPTNIVYNDQEFRVEAALTQSALMSSDCQRLDLMRPEASLMYGGLDLY